MAECQDNAGHWSNGQWPVDGGLGGCGVIGDGEYGRSLGLWLLLWLVIGLELVI